jgi:peroxiredoxin
MAQSTSTRRAVARNLLIGALALTPAIVVAALLFSEPSHAVSAASVGNPAPAFTLRDESGKTHSLQQYRGNIVVLEWTNSGCPFVVHHARKQTMAKTAKAFSEKSVVWLAINSTFFNRPGDSRRWRAKNGLGYPTLQDPEGSVGRAYGARTTPHMFVIDAAGVLRYAGAIDDDPHFEKQRPNNYVHGAVAALLAGKQPSPASTRPYGCSVKYKKR